MGQEKLVHFTDAFIYLRSEMCTGTMCAELGSTFEQSFNIDVGTCSWC